MSDDDSSKIGKLCLNHAERIRSLETWVKVSTGTNLIGFLSVVITLFLTSGKG